MPKKSTDPNDRGGRALLPERFPQVVERSRRIIVGLSGGGDSLALLHALRHRLGDCVEALHIHHGLQAQADEWADLNENLCSDWGVRFRTERVLVPPDSGKGPEAAARLARYSVFERMVKAGDILALAHHLNDQAETVLLRLLRGSGLTGLGGMRALRPIAEGWLWRPLLAVPQRQIQAYAGKYGLVGIEDPQNHDPKFARSFLRQRLMPELIGKWPKAAAVLARTATVLSEAADLQQEIAAQDLSLLAFADGSLSISGLLALSDARRRNLLRFWIEGCRVSAPSRDAILRMEREVLMARADANPCLKWPGAEIRRYRDALYVMAPLAPRKPYLMSWNGQGSLLLPDGLGSLDLLNSGFQGWQVGVRNSSGKDRFKPVGSNHSRSLKNLSQEMGIASWVRHRMPLIERNGKLLWAAGVGWAQDAHLELGLSGDLPTIKWTTTLPFESNSFGEQQLETATR